MFVRTKRIEVRYQTKAEIVSRVRRHFSLVQHRATACRKTDLRSRNLTAPGTGYKILLLLRPWKWALARNWANGYYTVKQGTVRTYHTKGNRRISRAKTPGDSVRRNKLSRLHPLFLFNYDPDPVERYRWNISRAWHRIPDKKEE